nr:type IV secretory system conjugative DNA transfer family protein [Klebsiella variicola]
MKLKLIVLLTLPLLAANVARADDSDVKGTDYYMDPPSQSDDEADVTGSMLNDAAHTIGFRGGKAERAKEIRAALENQRSNLDYMYSFQPLISSEGYLPPVIAEAKDVAHITNEQIERPTVPTTLLCRHALSVTHRLEKLSSDRIDGAADRIA